MFKFRDLLRKSRWQRVAFCFVGSMWLFTSMLFEAIKNVFAFNVDNNSQLMICLVVLNLAELVCLIFARPYNYSKLNGLAISILSTETAIYICWLCCALIYQNVIRGTSIETYQTIDWVSAFFLALKFVLKSVFNLILCVYYLKQDGLNVYKGMVKRYFYQILLSNSKKMTEDQLNQVILAGDLNYSSDTAENLPSASVQVLRIQFR